MNKYLLLLLGMSLGGSIMALLLLALRPRLHRSGHHTALYYLYLPVLLRLLIPIPGFLTLTLPQSAEIPAAVTAKAPAVARPVHDEPAVEPGRSAQELTAHSEPSPLTTPQPVQEAAPASVPMEEAPTARPAVSQPTVAPVSASAAPRFSLLRLVVIVHLTGTVLALCYYLGGYLRFVNAVFRTGRRAPETAYDALIRLIPSGSVGLMCSPAAPVPLLLGLTHPLIVLPPNTVNDDELDDVLRHELTHCRRHDLPYKWLMILALCVHWYNPLLYILRRTMAADCELSCDEALIRRMDPRQRQHYGETLIRLSSHPQLSPAIPAATLSEGKEQLRERLLSIMKGASARPATLTWVLCALLLCGCGALFGNGRTVETLPPAAPTITWQRNGVMRRMNSWSTDGNIWYETGAVTYDRDGLYTTDGNVWYFNGCSTTDLYKNVQVRENRWSTDGNIWYLTGQPVYDRSGFYTTDGNVWSTYGFWTTNGNSLYSMPLRSISDLHTSYVPYYTTDGNVRDDSLQIVTVSNADEFLAALQSNVIIQLLPGVYDFTTASVGYYPSIHWRPSDGKQQMLATDLYNTAVLGISGDSADVVLRFGSGAEAGFLLQHCYNLNFQHLTFSIDVGIEDPSNILCLRQCNGLYLGDCTFESTGGSAVYSVDSSHITLEDSRFAPTARGNVEMNNCHTLYFHRCDFDDTGSLLPDVSNCSYVLFEDCSLDGLPVEQEDLYA